MADRLTGSALNAACPYSTDDALDWFRDWAREHPTATVVLIGAGPGVMALALLEGSTDICLTVIEIGELRWIREHLLRSGLELGGVYLIQGDSGAFGHLWQVRRPRPGLASSLIDLLIIDGDHSYRGVKRDIEAWVPHVSPRGIVVFDDLYREGAEWDGIRQAVAEDWAERARMVQTKQVGVMGIFERLP